MSNICINNFKAFKNTFDFTFTKNVLVYGENGVGKSSLFDALRWFFFYRRMKDDSQKGATNAAEGNQMFKDFKKSFNNKLAATDFNITVDGTSYSTYNSRNIQPFMFSWNLVHIDDTLDLKALLESAFMTIDSTVDRLLNAKSDLIIKKVNYWLRTIFMEKYNIGLEGTQVIFHDVDKNIHAKNNLRSQINEAKINITVLLLFCAAVLFTTKKRNHTKLIIFDDILSSIDEANRFCFIRIILDKLPDINTISFTHNTGYFNTFYEASFHSPNSSDWSYYVLYHTSDKVCIRDYTHNFADVCSDITNEINANNLNAAGNKLRSEFCYQMTLLSNKLLLGEKEQTIEILDRILKQEPIYFNEDLTVFDLIANIDAMTSDGTKNKSHIKTAIDDFRHSDLKRLEKELNAMYVYRKIIMHPASHLVALPPLSTKELTESLILLKKIRNLVRAL